MKRSKWTSELKNDFVVVLGMSEFEAGKAAEIAAGHAVGPWDAERIVVRPVAAHTLIGRPELGYLLTLNGREYLSNAEAERAAEILNGYEAARADCTEMLKEVSIEPFGKTLLAFLQIEEDEP